MRVMNFQDGIIEASFHHLGLLTDNPEAASIALSTLGYFVAEPVVDPLQDVILRMADGGPQTARIEIITPRSLEGPLANLLKRRGDYMYHSCFGVMNVEIVTRKLAEVGLRVVTLSAPKPAILFDNAKVSFHSIEGIGLVEFIEYGCR